MKTGLSRCRQDSPPHTVGHALANHAMVGAESRCLNVATSAEVDVDTDCPRLLFMRVVAVAFRWHGCAHFAGVMLLFSGGPRFFSFGPARPREHA